MGAGRGGLGACGEQGAHGGVPRGVCGCRLLYAPLRAMQILAVRPPGPRVLHRPTPPAHCRCAPAAVLGCYSMANQATAPPDDQAALCSARACLRLQVAAQRLAVDPASCLVVEDSTIGLAAALGAGMRCLVTYTNSTRSQARSMGCSRVGHTVRLPLACPAVGLLQPGDRPSFAKQRRQPGLHSLTPCPRAPRAAAPPHPPPTPPSLHPGSPPPPHSPYP